MEEIIKEIKQAEENAAKLIADAEKEAADILASIDGEIEMLKTEYDEKLRLDCAAVLNSTKARINKLHKEEEESSCAKANKIKQEASSKVKPCADMVYDFIIKEFTE